MALTPTTPIPHAHTHFVSALSATLAHRHQPKDALQMTRSESSHSRGASTPTRSREEDLLGVLTGVDPAHTCPGVTALKTKVEAVEGQKTQLATEVSALTAALLDMAQRNRKLTAMNAGLAARVGQLEREAEVEAQRKEKAVGVLRRLLE